MLRRRGAPGDAEMDLTYIHKTILDSMSEAVYVIDRGMSILYTNPAAEELTGHSFDETVGKQCHDIFCERSELCEGRCPPKKAMKEEVPILHKDAETRSKTGELRQTQISISPFYEGGQCVGSVIVIKDITELKRAEERLRKQHKFLSTVIDALPHPFYVIDAGSYRLELANRIASVGRHPESLTCHELSHHRSTPCDSEDHPCPLEKVKETGTAAAAEHTHYDADGNVRNVEVHCFPIFDDGGKIIQVGEYNIDITERKLFEQRLQQMAFSDALTGIPNRALFFDRINHAIEMAKRNGRAFALLFLDLDQFKSVNDNLGHNAGDMVLKEAAQRLRDCIRGSDTVARMGGDEFAIILTEITYIGDTEIVARKIVDSLTIPFHLGDRVCSVGVSIGISLYPADGSDADELLKRADTAMYHAKKRSDHFFRFGV
jgi:diguanylate cyclase (GGDEF)-like protein/PAS domain S-box-containing protein